jgi:phage-related protein
MRWDWPSSGASIPRPSRGRATVRAYEVVENHAGDTYRAVYPVRFAKVVYVLHAFQKKSPKGIGTAQPDIDLVERRLKAAQKDYEARHDKPDG